KATINTRLAGFKVRAVIQMEHDRDVGTLDDSSLNQLHQVGVVGVGTSTLGHLEDQGSVQVAGGLGDTLHDLHVVDIKRANGVTTVIGLLKHFLRSDQRHMSHLLKN